MSTCSIYGISAEKCGQVLEVFIKEQQIKLNVFPIFETGFMTDKTSM
jgi:hypothetical protein